jgi:glycosyltransferase involved in cell wall biosynthesis
MKVAIVGTHGVPARYGGFETFAAHLAAACVKEGIEVTVINEKDNPSVPVPAGVKIIKSSYNKGEDPVKFYRESLMKASKDSDIIVCCGVGGAYTYTRLKNFPGRVITNIDGLEHLRSRYNALQRFVIFQLQKFASKYSDILIADSNEMKKYWMSRFPQSRQKIETIAYGAEKCCPMDLKVLEECKVAKGEYFLVIARLVPENNISEIIDAHNSYIGNKKLVIVGSLDDNQYVRDLEKKSGDKVLFTDSVYDKSFLDSLRQGCFLYIHGHSVGGTNPSLLEAMAAGCACMCHDNVFNREVTDGNQMYFRSSSDLSIMLNLLEHKASDLDILRKKSIEKISSDYTWDKVCSTYINLFHQLKGREAKLA